ncbi:flagellar basal body-associated protein FliL [Plastorhodobacter daqingensis]|uniref:Flagellar protein FliL n=1 Tax=Plastorhodobacter daqingensis TaxID=1387281 RepID=A0ABW2UJK4_9RHOB
MARAPAPAALAEDPPAPPRRKGKLLRFILMPLAALLLVGLGLGAGYVLFGRMANDPSAQIEQILERRGRLAAETDPADAQATPAEPARRESPAPTVFVTTYYEFPGTFTTNLRNSRRFLQVGIGVSTQYDTRVITNVETHQLALRSEILSVISEFTEEEVQGKEGRDRMAGAMRDAINDRLVRLENFGGIESVHFTSFILQ